MVATEEAGTERAAIIDGGYRRGWYRKSRHHRWRLQKRLVQKEPPSSMAATEEVVTER
jgi:hypothetical protein